MATTETTLIALLLLHFFGFGNAWMPQRPHVVLFRLSSGFQTNRRSARSGTGPLLRAHTLEEAPSCQTPPLAVVEGGNNTDYDNRMIEGMIQDSESFERLSSEKETANSATQAFTAEQKFTNLVVLCLAFGYAAYTILSIDSGMTRGWSPSEIAMRIPLDNWGAYESYLANKPIFTKSLINVIIYLLGDWLSQTAFTKTNNLLEFDLQRTLRNGLIGLCFGPLVHGYYEFSDTILPPQNGLVTRMEKILMDQTIYLTVKCSLYIGAVGILAGEDTKHVGQTIKDKIGGIVITAWKFWPIVHCVTYSVIPAQHRVLWVNSVDLVWNAILSSAAQEGQKSEETSVKPASTG